MWTEESRGRVAKIARKTTRYPCDLTDEEWERIAALMPKPGRRGRPREVDFREVINAVRYLVRSGCGWRMLPIHFGPWQTVYGWFRELARRFLFQTIHDIELMLDRERQGREQSPSAGVIDSQSIKAPHAKTRGYDAGKKIVGRKRHIAVDTDGRLLMVNLTTADISDSAGAQAGDADLAQQCQSEGLGTTCGKGVVSSRRPPCLAWRRNASAARGRLARPLCRGQLGRCERCHLEGCQSHDLDCHPAGADRGQDQCRVPRQCPQAALRPSGHGAARRYSSDR